MSNDFVMQWTKERRIKKEEMLKTWCVLDELSPASVPSSLDRLDDAPKLFFEDVHPACTFEPQYNLHLTISKTLKSVLCTMYSVQV